MEKVKGNRNGWSFFSLPWAPSVNHYYQRSKRSLFLSQRGRRFRDDVAGILRPCSPIPESNYIEMKVDLFPPDKRKRDIDNNLKALLDALENAGAYENDVQIISLSIVKHGSIGKPGRIDVWFRPVKKISFHEGDSLINTKGTRYENGGA